MFLDRNSLEDWGLKCLLVIVVAIIGLFVKFIAIVTSSYLLGILIILVLVGWLLRTVGCFAMYPGCFGLVKSDIEIRASGQMVKKIQHIVRQFYQFTGVIQHNQPMIITNGRLPYCPPLFEHAIEVISILQMFEGKLSPRKTQLLYYYRQIVDIFNQEIQNKFSIRELINMEQKTTITPEQHAIILRRCTEIINHLNSIFTIIRSLMGPLIEENPSTYQLFKYKLKGQKVYEIWFAYRAWDKKYNYSRYTVSTSDAYELECAVINHLLHDEDKQSQQAVLICNPNGAYLQYFGIQSHYISYYLSMGFKIILWNYRGYGRSTGSPSISQSIEDAETIYQYALNTLNLNPIIVHGYSIGGSPAIKLAHNHSERIKLLIADRTFNNVADMATDFGKGLKTLTEIFFYKDCINIASTYAQVKTNKLMIWDSVDEVVKNGCSLREAILKEYITNYKETPQTSGEKDDSDEQITFNKGSTTIVNILHHQIINSQNQQRFISAIRNIVGNHTLTPNSVMDEEIPNHIEPKTKKQALIQHLGPLDGGGYELFNEDNLSLMKSQKFKEYVATYLKGLTYFGSLTPFSLDNYKLSSVKQQTQKKISTTIEEAKKQCSLEDEKDSMDTIYSIYQEIGDRWGSVNDSGMGHPQLGILMPTSVGHNGDLEPIHLKFLKNIINNSCQ